MADHPQSLEGDGQSLTQQYTQWCAGLEGEDLPTAVREVAQRALLDVVGLCVAARETDYIQATRAAWEGVGSCTAFGHPTPMDTAGAALINGVAAHGEDFDDTFEGTPVHTGAVIIPAVLAACEAQGRSGDDLVKGIAVGMELMCRMALVAPTAQHKAGFHPTSVIGAMGATAGVGTALGLTSEQLTHALGVAGSMAGGIIEYLAEGTWSKRLHPGWAAQSGIRAALLGRSGFVGPRTVLEGTHGFYFAFGIPDIPPDFSQITRDLGENWLMEQIAFKPFACGTMVQPYIDCAVTLAGEGLDPDTIERIVCKVGEGTVHRLWEPLAEKRSPTTPYSAKFSVPYGIAMGLLYRASGLEQYTQERLQDPRVGRITETITYEIDPDNEYPRNYTGHMRVYLKGGDVREVTQPHLRGGKKEPLTWAELEKKFRANTAYGGWEHQQADAFQATSRALFSRPNLSGLAEFRR